MNGPYSCASFPAILFIITQNLEKVNIKEHLLSQSGKQNELQMRVMAQTVDRQHIM
jgi:hypothetical protein